MRYLSLFSGIEAASVAWEPLGWECVAVSEIEPFPCAVLAHHYHDVPNLGDVTKITTEQIAALGPIDLVVGGSPCQDLSVAGMRKGLSGERSGLFSEQMRIFHAARTLCGARFLLWENVPGAFTCNKGKDFAVVVGAMAGLDDVKPPANGWGSEGAALGDNGLVEWAVLDAQWFGLAQRRKRVFAVLDTGDWANRPPILLEPESLRGDSPPRREKREEATHNIAPCLTGSGRGVQRVGDPRGQDTVVAVSPTLRAGDNSTGGHRPQGTDVDTCESLVPLAIDKDIPVAGTLISRASGGGGFPGMDMACAGYALPCWWDGGQVSQTLDAVLHKGQTMPEKNRFPAVLTPISVHGTQDPDVKYDMAHTLGRNNGQENAILQGVSHTLRADGFDASEDGTGRGTPLMPVASREVAQALTSNYGKQPDNSDTGKGPTLAISLRGRAGGGTAELGDEVGNALRASQGGGDKPHVLANMAVRRITPVEAERLQGFPDNWTRIPWRNKPADVCPDGPRYKAIGNSFAVPVVRWIGEQIQKVARMVNKQESAA